MPAGTKIAEAESAIRAAGRKRGLKGEALDRYVYGRLNEMGFKKGNVTTKKGAAKASKK